MLYNSNLSKYREKACLKSTLHLRAVFAHLRHAHCKKTNYLEKKKSKEGDNNSNYTCFEELYDHMLPLTVYCSQLTQATTKRCNSHLRFIDVISIIRTTNKHAHSKCSLCIE